MKKIYALGLAVFAAMSLNAQVSVTFKVDVTDYIGGGETIAANGVRIGGNFGDNGSTTASWNPTDASCALTDEGNNVWSITVEFPDSAAGNTQLYKFVNGDWGSNEGLTGSTIATDGCGVDDGGGNINRTLEIPASNLELEFCWDACFKCDGSDPVLVGVNDVKLVSDFTVAPNPAVNATRFSFSLAQSENVTLKIYNILGAEVATVLNGTIAAGTHNVEANLDNLESGVYLYVLRAGNRAHQGKISKN